MYNFTCPYRFEVTHEYSTLHIQKFVIINEKVTLIILIEKKI